MKQITIAALIMLMASSALAFLDPAPNTIGIYLDTEAETMCVEGLTDGMTSFTFYMVLTNPSFDTMEGFVAGFHFDGIATVNTAVLAEAGAIDGGSLGDHLVHYATPVPTSANMLLMTLTATYHDFEYGSALLKLHGIQLAAKDMNVPWVLLPGGDSMDLNLTYDDGVTIRINASCGPVANENLTIDGIKSLYR